MLCQSLGPPLALLQYQGLFWYDARLFWWEKGWFESHNEGTYETAFLRLIVALMNR